MIGELVGHDRVVASLGSGGMGVVWKAIDTRLNRPVALKAIREADATNTDAILRLRAEALAAASLDMSTALKGWTTAAIRSVNPPARQPKHPGLN